MEIEIAIHRDFIRVAEGPDAYKEIIRGILKSKLKVVQDKERGGVNIKMQEATEDIQNLTTAMLISVENSFIMQNIVDKLDALGKDLNSKFGKEKADELINIFNTFVFDDIFARLEMNNQILKSE